MGQWAEEIVIIPISSNTGGKRKEKVSVSCRLYILYFYFFFDELQNLPVFCLAGFFLFCVVFFIILMHFKQGEIRE